MRMSNMHMHNTMYMHMYMHMCMYMQPPPSSVDTDPPRATP